MGAFGRIVVELAKGGGDTDEIMIPLIDCSAINCRARDATHLKAPRTAASLLKKGLFPGLLDAQKAA